MRKELRPLLRYSISKAENCRRRGNRSPFPLCLQVAEVNHLDDEILALHSEIVELQRSPYARRQGDKMEQL